MSTPPPPPLWTHALEPQRKLLLGSCARLLRLETSLRRGKLPVSLAELDKRLLLIAAIATSLTHGTPWPADLEALTATPLIRAELARLRAQVDRLPPNSKNDVDG